MFGSNGKGLSQSDIDAITQYNNQLKQGVTSQTAWNRTMLQASPAAQHMVSSANGAAVAVENLGTGAELTRWQLIKLQAASMALNIAISMGAMVAIQGIIKGIDYLIHRTEKMQEALENSVSEFNSVTDELKSLEEELKTTTERLAELQKLADNTTISVAEEAELETLKKTNKELAKKVALKQQEQAQEARDVLKDSKKNATSKVDSEYKTQTTSSGNYTYKVDVLPSEELEMAINAYNNAEKTLSDPNRNKEWDWMYEDNMEKASNRIEEMYALISPTIEAYEALIDAGIELDGEDKTRYEQLKKSQDAYLAYIYTLNGTREAFEGLNAEQQRNLLLNRLINQGLSEDVAKAIVGSISDEDLSKYWDKNFSFVPPEMEDGESAEEYGKRYAEAWAKGLEEGVKNANKMTVSLSELEGVSDKIKVISSAFKEISDDGYITIKTLGEIQVATNLSGDEWAEYENKLLKAKVGSDDFNQILSDLTYKILENEFATIGLENVTEEQIVALLRENGVINANAMAQDISAKAKIKAQIAAENLTYATDEQIKKLYEEGKAFGLTETALFELRQAYGEAQKTMTKLTSEGVLDRLRLLKSELDGIKNIADAYKTIVESRTKKDGEFKDALGFTRYDPFSKSKSERQVSLSLSPASMNYKPLNDDEKQILAFGKAQEEIQGIIDNFNLDYERLGFSNIDKNDPSSGNNTPDYEDPTEATINRINLRHRELEQQEEEIQNLIEIAELEKDYGKQISSTNDLIATRKKRIDELNTANDTLHQMAEDLRNSTPQWKEEEWFDSQGEESEAYINFINKRIEDGASKEEIEAIKDQFEKISKIKEAWVANAEEISTLNKNIIQDERETIPQLWEELMDDGVSDIEHRIELRNNLVSPDHESNIVDYEEIKRLAHLRADEWRAAGYSEDSEEVQKWQKTWWDAENSILDESRKIFDERLQLSEDYIQRSKDFGWENGDSEIKARKRVLDWIQSDYYKSLIKDDKEYYKILEEHRLNYLEAQKEEFNKANNFGSSYLDSRKTLLQSYYDVTNSIAEAQHDINKELEASKTMYEYLNEDTRKLLFNQDDYNVLCKKLIDIQSEADRLQKQYEYDLRHSTLDTVEQITSNYQMQYETLMKSYEIAKADLEIAKKKQKLDNVLNERNVRMRINGKWQYVAKTQDVINAQSELADAEYAKRVQESGLVQQESINNLTKQQDELTTVINKFESGVITLDEAVADAAKAIGYMPSALVSMYSNVSNKTNGKSNYSSGRILPVMSDGNAAKGAEIGDIIRTAGGDYEIVPLGTKGATYNPETGYFSIKIKEELADGTRSTLGGLTALGEVKDEVLITKHGRLIPINQPTIGNIGSGGIVFNHDQMDFARKIWDWSNIGTIPNSISNITNRQMGETNTYQMFGNMVFDGNNPEEIFRQLADFLKNTRYKGN